MDNKSIANVLSEMADILEIQGAIIFRINAYRRAALTIANLAYDVRDIVDKNPVELQKIPGIGQDLRMKIIELVETGKCAEHEQMKKGFPQGLLEMLRLRGVGPKKVKLFYGALKIKDVKELKEAAEKHLLRDLEGMGEKSENDVLKAIEEHAHYPTNRMIISEAMKEALRLISYMKKCKEVDRIEYAGSLRRKQETIGDIDILVTVKDAKKSHGIVMEYFVGYEEVIEVIAKGDTKSSVILASGINVDLRVVEDESFGAALHYFTGSKAHNIRVRDLAKRKGLKVNEYGVFKGEKMISGRKEEDIFKAVGLPYIIPELRKDDGEIEYGLKHGKFPKFVELKDIKGDLHSHSIYSDGNNTIEEMAKAFMAKGYEYFAVTDHSSVMGITGGMGSKDIKKQWQEIDKLNKKLKEKIIILKGTEVDILKDGSLDFSDEILKELDVVIISAHMRMKLSSEEQTARIIAAIENPYARILGHPSGRLINKRPPMEFNMEKVIEACVQNKVVIEINANPERLDIEDKYLRIAKSKGATIAINTDAHSLGQQDLMNYGINVARRGWLESKDILNTKNLKGLTLALKKL